MNLSTRIYLGALIAIFSGIAVLIFTGLQSTNALHLDQLRVGQLQSVTMVSGPEPQLLETEQDLILEDYFEKFESGYLYLGGVNNGPWNLDTIYTREDLMRQPGSFSETHFFSHPFGQGNFYINLDRIDQATPGDFLKAMESRGQMEIDTLVIDFRFLRSVEFGAVLRLFNQIAPSQKMILGTIIDSYHEEVIRTSGRPFFTVSQTVFILNEKVPDAVRLLIFNLQELDSYHIAGLPGPIADTVCLMSDFMLGDKTYRVCTEFWTTESGHKGVSPLKTVTASVRADLLRSVDELWYKRQDSSALAEQLPFMLTQLLP